MLRLDGVDEREGERADAQLRGEVDRLAIRTGDPQRWVRLLHGLGHDVASRHGEVRSLEARVGVHGHHVGDLFDGLAPHRPALGRVDPEAFQLGSRGALAGAELDAAVRDQVEGGDPLGDLRREVVARRHEDDAVTETDPFRALAGGGQEDLGCGGVAVLLEEVVLDLPGEVDAQLVRELDLAQCVLEQLQLVTVVPRPWQLVLVEDPELHCRPPVHGAMGFTARRIRTVATARARGRFGQAGVTTARRTSGRTRRARWPAARSSR